MTEGSTTDPSFYTPPQTLLRPLPYQAHVGQLEDKSCGRIFLSSLSKIPKSMFQSLCTSLRLIDAELLQLAWLMQFHNLALNLREKLVNAEPAWMWVLAKVQPPAYSLYNSSQLPNSASDPIESTITIRLMLTP